MPPLQALKLSWAKAGVQTYLDEVAATESGSEAPTSPGTSGVGSDVEDAAADAVMPGGKKKPVVVGRADVNSANAAWAAALGQQSKSQQLLADKDHASQELAQRLAAVDKQVMKDSAAAGLKPGPGPSNVTLELLAKGRLDAQAKPPGAGPAVLPKPALPGMPVVDGLPPDKGAVVVVDPGEASTDKAVVVGRVPVSQQFGAQLALNAQKTSLKRAASSSRDDSASSLPKRSKLISELVSTLGGSMPGGIDAGDERSSWAGWRSRLVPWPWEFRVGAWRYIRDSGVDANPGAERSWSDSERNGEVDLSTDQEDSESAARCIMMLHYEVLFWPNLDGTLSYGTERQMRTLATALDHLLDGDLAACGDVLISRFKALEEATTSGT